MATLRSNVFLLCLVVVGCSIQETKSVVSKRVHQFILSLTAKFVTHCPSGVSLSNVYCTPLPSIEEVDVEPDDFQQPLILIWNPNITHPAVVRERLSQCIVCRTPYSMGHYNDGSSSSRQPRMIHAVDNIVFLVSAVYICENNHRLLAHDAAILNCFPVKSVVPFMLVHKTGFLRAFADMCTSLVRSGMNFYAIETYIMERRMATYATGSSHFHLHQQVTHLASCESGFFNSPLSNCPSNDAVTKLFLASFLENENVYVKEMEKITIGNTISFDHTFKVASNIGYCRVDKVWVTQYDSLFLVMNSEGKIVTWQFTKGTSFEEVRNLLGDLYDRSQEQEQNIHTVYVDDCCKIRAKIKSVFGPTTTVKLDLFHAIQRVIRTLSKRHEHYHKCLLELRQVFREDGDSGESRISDTPSPQKMKSKLVDFSRTWENITDSSGQRIWTPDSAQATANLERHVSAACLSGIPPGFGTNRNERFHRFLNTFFNKSKIGIFLAYALMTVLIHAHNSDVKLNGKRVTQPISASPFQGKHLGQPRRMGIVPKSHQREETDDQWEMDISENTLDMQVILPIYLTCVQKFQILQALKNTRLHQMVRHVYAFQPFNLTHDNHNWGNNSTSIQERLSNFGLVCLSSPKDGNCFFKSVETNILVNPDVWKVCLHHAGIIDNYDIIPTNLHHHLRQAFVSEITGDRRPHYEDFIVDITDYSVEAKRFLEDGYYDSQLGNLMPLAMATVLQAHLIIFRTDNDTPFYVTPLTNPHDRAIFLVYDPQGCGHYDSAVAYVGSQQQGIPLQRPPVKCTCGRKTKEIGAKSCCPNPRYACRCVCLREGKSCTQLCLCKNCENPNGRRCTESSGNKVSRKRRVHALQINFPTSKKFAIDRGEEVTEGVWSEFETISLHQILYFSYQDITAILKVYNDLVYYSRSSFCAFYLPDNVVFREKSYRQMCAKLKHIGM